MQTMRLTLPCADNDTDEVKTVEDKMDHRSKRRLMNQVCPSYHIPLQHLQPEGHSLLLLCR